MDTAKPTKRRIIVVVDPNEERSRLVANQLVPYGDLYQALTVTTLQEVVQQHGEPYALFVTSELKNLTGNIQQLHKMLGKSRIYVVGTVAVGSIRSLTRAGVKDFADLELSKDWLVKEFGDAEDSLVPTPMIQSLPTSSADVEVDFGVKPSQTLERIFVVTGICGGDGTSTVAIQLAASLAKQGKRPLLIDANPKGNAARLLGREAVNSIAEFRTGNKRVEGADREILDSLLVQHPKYDLKILPSPLKQLTNVTSSMLENAIKAYRPYYPTIIIDCGSSGYNPLTDLACSYASNICVVVRPDLTRLERYKDDLPFFIEKQTNREKLILIVNRIRSDGDAQRIRVPMDEFKVPVYGLAFDKILDFGDRQGYLPAFGDPKSPYVKQFRRILSDGLKLKPAKSSGSKSNGTSSGNRPKKSSSNGKRPSNTKPSNGKARPSGGKKKKKKPTPSIMNMLQGLLGGGKKKGRRVVDED